MLQHDNVQQDTIQIAQAQAVHLVMTLVTIVTPVYVMSANMPTLFL